MTPEQIINDVTDHVSEYVEMSSDPSLLIQGILANKIIKLQKYASYLEKRVKYYENRNY